MGGLDGLAEFAAGAQGADAVGEVIGQIRELRDRDRAEGARRTGVNAEDAGDGAGVHQRKREYGGVAAAGGAGVPRFEVHLGGQVGDERETSRAEGSADRAGVAGGAGGGVEVAVDEAGRGHGLDRSGHQPRHRWRDRVGHLLDHGPADLLQQLDLVAGLQDVATAEIEGGEFAVAAMQFGQCCDRGIGTRSGFLLNGGHGLSELLWCKRMIRAMADESSESAVLGRGAASRKAESQVLDPERPCHGTSRPARKTRRLSSERDRLNITMSEGQVNFSTPIGAAGATAAGGRPAGLRAGRAIVAGAGFAARAGPMEKAVQILTHIRLVPVFGPLRMGAVPLVGVVSRVHALDVGYGGGAAVVGRIAESIWDAPGAPMRLGRAMLFGPQGAWGQQNKSEQQGCNRLHGLSRRLAEIGRRRRGEGMAADRELPPGPQAWRASRCCCRRS